MKNFPDKEVNIPFISSLGTRKLIIKITTDYVVFDNNKVCAYATLSRFYGKEIYEIVRKIKKNVVKEQKL